jgi:spermidine/putrescine transport system substrate-binding protein
MCNTPMDMPNEAQHSRRAVLAATGAGAVTTLAGCTSGGSSNSGGSENGSSSGGGGSGSSGPLRFLGFGGNTQKAQMSVFEGWSESSGTAVKGTSASGTTEMISLIKQNPGSFDIVALNDTGMARAKQEDVIEPIDLSEVPNYEKNIKESARTLSFNVDGDKTMGLIRENGATGYAYNSKKIDKELTSWEAVKNPEYEGKVSLIDRTMDRLSNCAAAAGVNINEVPGSESKKEKMFTEAEEQNKNVFAYWSDGATSIRYLRQENAWICEAWGGRVLALHEEGGYDHIKYVVPNEGAMGWSDNLAIVKGTKNKAAAHELLNHTYQREQLLTLSDKMNYTVQVKNPPKKMKQLPDYAPAEDLAFRDWSALLEKQDAWTQRLDKIKQS